MRQELKREHGKSSKLPEKLSSPRDQKQNRAKPTVFCKRVFFFGTLYNEISQKRKFLRLSNDQAPSQQITNLK
jgi:hypothetical protein